MTARLTINPRPLRFQQKLARVSSPRSDCNPPSLSFQMPCPHHLSDEISTFLQRLPRLPLPLWSLAKPCQAKWITCPSCPQLPLLCPCSPVGSHAWSCVILIHTSQWCWGSFFNHLLFTHRTWQKVWWPASRYSKIPSTELLEWITDSASVPSDGNFTGCTVYAPASLIPSGQSCEGTGEETQHWALSLSPALGPILQPCLGHMCWGPFTHLCEPQCPPW